jgi:hypothetical protein
MVAEEMLLCIDGLLLLVRTESVLVRVFLEEMYAEQSELLAGLLRL